MPLKIALAFVLICLLAAASLMTGVSQLSLSSLWEGGTAALVLAEVRLPRTLALMLAGAGLAVSGTIMQMLARNRYVEPSTAGTVESAKLGMLFVLLLAPDLPVYGRMLVASAFALAGTALFLLILSRIPLRTALMVPLVGIMLGGVIDAVTSFFAYRYDLMQSLGAWTSGDFSAVLRGRYELLWVALALTLVAYRAADRFTVSGMGEAFAANLGLDYRKIVALGLVIVSLVTACVVVTVGNVPFVGLIVPNILALAMGDNLRRSLPWTALLGAGLVLACDIVGRLLIAPFEIPVGTILGVAGSVFFLYLVLRRNARAA